MEYFGGFASASLAFVKNRELHEYLEKINMKNTVTIFLNTLTYEL